MIGLLRTHKLYVSLCWILFIDYLKLIFRRILNVTSKFMVNTKGAFTRWVRNDAAGSFILNPNRRFVQSRLQIKQSWQLLKKMWQRFGLQKNLICLLNSPKYAFKRILKAFDCSYGRVRYVAWIVLNSKSFISVLKDMNTPLVIELKQQKK